MQVPASGGNPSPVTVLDASRKEAAHAFPSFLPDGRHFIYVNLSDVPEETAAFMLVRWTQSPRSGLPD